MHFLIVITALLFQYWDDSEVVRALKSHVEEITAPANEGRAPGSEGEKAVAKYIAECFEVRGLDVLSGTSGDVFGIGSETGDTIVSRNVMAYVEGYDKELKNHFIVVGARMDNMGKLSVTLDGEP